MIDDKFCWGRRLRLWNDVQTRPGAPRRKHVVNGEIETELGGLGDPIIPAKGIRSFHFIQKMFHGT